MSHGRKLLTAFNPRPLFLRGPFFPKHVDNRMRHEGNVAAAREEFLQNRSTNLDFLLKKRFHWMLPYLPLDGKIVEFGSGAGFARLYLNQHDLILTDVENFDWIDVQADALNSPFKSESLDCIICNHVIHHFATPSRFFENAIRILKPGGHILINEPEASFLLRSMIRLLRIEGWSYAIDPFDDKAICNDPNDAWSGNNAVSQLLFLNKERFETRFPKLRIVQNDLCECFIFLISGGVTSKIFTVPLPTFLLQVIEGLDRSLISFLPRLLPLGRRIAIKKVH